VCDVGNLIAKIMGLVSKRLMKWREPKIQGMVTSKNIVTAVVLILILAIPFGFWGGNGKFFGGGRFSISIYFLGLGFLSIAPAVLLLQSVFPGSQIQLREDAIVRLMSRRNQRSVYKDIDCIYFYRDCSHSWNRGVLVVNIHQRSVEGPNFTNFEVKLKNDVIVDGVRQLSFATLRSVHRFAVPNDVNLDQVLQILRDKGVNVVEGPLPS